MKIWTKEQQIALGLTSKESGLLGVLNKKGTLNTSALAHRSSLPRVTAMRILNKLQKRGFVTRQEKRRAVAWSLVNPVLLEKRLAHLFEKSGVFNKSSIGLSEVGSLTIYRGVEEMLESNRKMLVAHAGERVLAVEPNGIWRHFPKDQSDAWRHLNLLFKQKQILIEMVTEEGFESILKKEVSPDIEETFLSLAVDIRVVPAGVLDSTTEILIFRDQMLMTDWADRIAVEIKNPSTVRVVKAMYRMLQKNGRKYKTP
ncbi:MAG: helix-turn-helix domain-containing protein [Patescibacteria group bacterium]